MISNWIRNVFLLFLRLCFALFLVFGFRLNVTLPLGWLIPLNELRFNKWTLLPISLFFSTSICLYTTFPPQRMSTVRLLLFYHLIVPLFCIIQVATHWSTHCWIGTNFNILIDSNRFTFKLFDEILFLVNNSC